MRCASELAPLQLDALSAASKSMNEQQRSCAVRLGHSRARERRSKAIDIDIQRLPRGYERRNTEGSEVGFEGHCHGMHTLLVDVKQNIKGERAQ